MYMFNKCNNSNLYGNMYSYGVYLVLIFTINAQFNAHSLLRYVDLTIVLTGIKSGTLLGATVIRCRRN